MSAPGPFEVRPLMGGGYSIRAGGRLVGELAPTRDASDIARLFEAAPDLLAALEAVLDFLPHQDGAPYEQARAAISKAKGGAR